MNDLSSAFFMVIGIILVYQPLYNDTLGVFVGYGFLICFVSNIFTSLGNILIARRDNIDNTYSYLGLSMIFGSFFIITFMAFSGKNTLEIFLVKDVTYLLMLGYVALVCTAVIYMLYAQLIKAIGPVRASFVWLVSPFIAMLLSAIYEDYTINIYTILGALTYLAGGLVTPLLNKINVSSNQPKNSITKRFQEL